MDIVLTIMRMDTPGIPDGPKRWKAGDIVTVREVKQPLPLNRGECNNPRACLLVITHLPPIITDINQILALVEMKDFTDDLDPGSDLLSVRRYNLDFSALPTPRRRALLEPPHYLERTWAQVKGSIIKNKKTLNYLDDVDFV